MAGLYIHIPFCKKRCHYCDFYSSVKLSEKSSYIAAISIEVEREKDFFQNESVNSIYFGGGTPSLLTRDDIQILLGCFQKHFSIDKNAEITLEANPDDLTLDYLRQLRELGINRLSIGIQSFFDEKLRLLNRRHTAEEAEKSVWLAKEAGFDNISIDLIYGIPGLHEKEWEISIQRALQLPVEHISAYHLTFEKNTAFYQMLLSKKIKENDEELSLIQFNILIDNLQKSGFEHYEISNFAKNNRYSIHNSNYWKGVKYLGLGASAHSFDGESRRWNVGNLYEYTKGIQAKEKTYEKEILNKTEKMNEQIMISLRTMWGLDIIEFKNRFGIDHHLELKSKADPFIRSGDIIESNHRWTLSTKGKMISDLIIEKLFYG